MKTSVLSNTLWSISPDNCVAWPPWLLKEAAGLLGKNQVQLDIEYKVSEQVIENQQLEKIAAEVGQLIDV